MNDYKSSQQLLEWKGVQCDMKLVCIQDLLYEKVGEKSLNIGAHIPSMLILGGSEDCGEWQKKQS